eukprot:TRINITY_DN41911_c0_g1_i1.p1 TRINITY_DN41911_c0_g1~~TRINITY_DN41911_c0_g1_i1.p1  ORF type:complete len:316 (-),score=50.77 TRINITY_DN41911_c0_g1_i1:223-1170(-)
MAMKICGLLATVAALNFLLCYSSKVVLRSNSTNSIPKIMHQLAPADKTHWPDAWFVCQESWKNLYSDWTYMLWNDDDVESLVKNTYPEEYSWFRSMPMNIERVDAARSFILHAYGGLYADMDYYCYKKLEIPEDGKAILVASNMGDEIVQNSLMASPRGHPFWKLTFKAMADFNKEHLTRPERAKEGDFVLEATGPNMLGRVLKTMGGQGMIDKLDMSKYNPGVLEGAKCTPQTCFTRHLLTGCWAVGVACTGWQRDFVDERSLNEAARKAKNIGSLLQIPEEDKQTDAPINTTLQFYRTVGPHLAVWHNYIDSK